MRRVAFLLQNTRHKGGGNLIMAERRMFTQKITEADNFTALPPTTQCLYFHLCMNADDDGFSNKIRQAMFNAHADQNDFEMLVQKRFILPFDSGVIVIKHWRMHNLIRSDRYHETDYIEEKAALLLKENGVYTDKIPSDNQLTTIGIPSDNQLETEVRLGKVSKGKESINNNSAPQKPKRESKHAYGVFKHVRLTMDEYKRLTEDYGHDETNKAIDFFDAYIEEKGYKSKSHNMAMRRWVFDAVKEREQKRAKINGKAPNKFNNFQQNQYTPEEFSELEKQLLDN